MVRGCSPITSRELLTGTIGYRCQLWIVGLFPAAPITSRESRTNTIGYLCQLRTAGLFPAGLQQQQQPDHEGQRQHPVRAAGVPGQAVGPTQLAGCLCGPCARPTAVPLPLTPCWWGTALCCCVPCCNRFLLDLNHQQLVTLYLCFWANASPRFPPPPLLVLTLSLPFPRLLTCLTRSTYKFAMYVTHGMKKSMVVQGL